MSPGSIATFRSMIDSRREVSESPRTASPAAFLIYIAAFALPPSTIHVPVLIEEVLAALAPRAGQTIVDGTLGGAGHFRRLAEALWPPHADANSCLIGLDRDAGAIAAAEAIGQTDEANLKRRIELVQANFCNLPDVLDELGIQSVDAVLLDLGLSSDQLADASRGFSFTADGPLDLRFNVDEGQPAWRMLARLSAEDMANLIYELGEERFSRRIARAIVAAREKEPPRTAAELAEIVRRAVPRAARHAARIDPATRTFQALRIAVNRELEALDEALRVIPDRLNPGGRFAIISFHSLEDRRVKEAFRNDPRLRPITKKPIRPTEEEMQSNPRSRSSRLRVAERVP